MTATGSLPILSNAYSNLSSAPRGKARGQAWVFRSPTALSRSWAVTSMWRVSSERGRPSSSNCRHGLSLPKKEANSMRRPKVLIIDDEAEFSTTLAERLALRDYEALAPTSLSQVKSLIAEELPDVLLLDLRMPGLNGLELLRETKRTDPGIEIIVVTGLTGPSVVTAALKAGASDFVTKPVDISQLMEKIDEVTSRQKDRRTHHEDL